MLEQDPQSQRRPERAVHRGGEGLGPLAADQQPGSVGELEPHATIAAGDERALAIAAVADPQKP